MKLFANSDMTLPDLVVARHNFTSMPLIVTLQYKTGHPHTEDCLEAAC